ncbi:MAG: Lipoprotein signal peptidase [Lentisphaerae bacterium ADurb.BinA184]|nr:MAG: Lipoprotein signal peptidase [Lentisphaerae bacterium ADurb.BinA184]
MVVNRTTVPSCASPAAPASAARPSALLSRRPLALLIVLLLAAADQWSKDAVCRGVPLSGQVHLIPGCLSLVHFRNTGAAWGLFQGLSPVLATVSVAVLGFIAWRYRQLAAGRVERAFALLLVAGGVLGNFVDRVLRGEVVDFVRVYYRSFEWPAFNLADSAICCGVALFLYSSIRHPDPDQAPNARPTSQTSPGQ